MKYADGLVVDFTEKEINKIAEIKARRYPIKGYGNGYNAVHVSHLMKNYKYLSEIFEVSESTIQRAVAKYRKQERKNRERKVIDLYRKGKTITQIGQYLDIPRTTCDAVLKRTDNKSRRGG